MTPQDPHPLCVVGVGAAGALGLSPNAIASAVLADLSAFELLSGAPWGLKKDIRAAMCPLLDAHTEPETRLCELLRFALAAALPPGDWSHCTVKLGLAVPAWAEQAECRERLEQMVHDLLPSLGLQPFLRRAGNTSASLRVLAGLAKALAGTHRDTPALAVWAGVDSMLHADLLAALAEKGLLSRASQPEGVVPSEGAAALVLTRERDALALGLPILGRLSVPYREKPVPGAATHEALTSALTHALGDKTEPSITHLISDATFMPARAIALGQALAATQSITDQCTVITPSAHLGELGAAFGPMAAAIALQAMAAGLVFQGQGVICAADDSSSAACRLLGPWQAPVMLADRPHQALSAAG